MLLRSTCSLITGAVVVEVVFVYPGIGQLFVDSVKIRIFQLRRHAAPSLPQLILLNLTADTMATLSNPRLSIRSQGGWLCYMEFLIWIAA